MNSFFNFENPIFHFLTRLTDFIILNLLFIICCTPIITIGPSITALYYCMLKITRNCDSSITGMFFHSLKNNLKQGSLLTVIFIFAITFLIVDINVCNTFEISMLQFIKIGLYCFTIFLVAIISYSFPLLAQFDNTIKNILKNAFIMALGNIGYTTLIVILNLIPVVLLLFFPQLFILSIPFWIITGFSLIAKINSSMFVNIFNRFIP